MEWGFEKKSIKDFFNIFSIYILYLIFKNWNKKWLRATLICQKLTKTNLNLLQNKLMAHFSHLLILRKIWKVRFKFSHCKKALNRILHLQRMRRLKNRNRNICHIIILMTAQKILKWDTLKLNRNRNHKHICQEMKLTELRRITPNPCVKIKEVQPWIIKHEHKLKIAKRHLMLRL